jgi:hypothetical protein
MLHIPPGCYYTFVQAPIYMSTAQFASFSAAANQGRTVYLTDADGSYTSVSTGVGVWVWQKNQDVVVCPPTPSLDGNPIVLASGTVTEGSSTSLFAVVTGDRGGGVETGSFLIFAGVRRAVAGAAVLVPGGSLEVAAIKDSVLPAPAWTSAFAVAGNDWQLTATGVAATTITWTAYVIVRNSP